MARWRIYYGDDTVFSSDDGTPFDAPTLNIQVIAQEDPDATGGRILIHGHNVYFWLDDGGWHGADRWGVDQYLFTQGIPKYLVFGTTMNTKAFMRIRDRASREGLGS